jgi:hypothetical protein
MTVGTCEATGAEPTYPPQLALGALAGAGFDADFGAPTPS